MLDDPLFSPLTKCVMMTSLKTWCLLPITVLLLSIAPTVTEVVQSMAQCEGFLLQETPPQIPGILENGNIKDKKRYKIICQTYDDEKRFVTLYDTTNKIPVFSAYKFRSRALNPRHWMIEPQLENPNDDQNMKDCIIRVEYTNQASDKDYKDDTSHDVEKGHLRPFSYGFDQNDKISTCTLTNSVPQNVFFNQGSWATMERCVKCILDNYCLNKEGYLVTGAKPGTVKLNNRVNIPSMLWSAFCCQSEDKWLASAFWGDNTAEKSKYLPMKTLAELHDKLSKGHSSFEAFPGSRNCPLNETPDNQIKEKCQCSA